MNPTFSGYLLYKKELNKNTKYIKHSEAGEIPSEMFSEVLYLTETSSPFVKNLVKHIKGEYFLRSSNKTLQTSLFLRDSDNTPFLTLGDIQKTDILLIVLIYPDKFEVFTAPGKKPIKEEIVRKLLKGKLKKETEKLRKTAAENTPGTWENSLKFDFPDPLKGILEFPKLDELFKSDPIEPLKDITDLDFNFLNDSPENQNRRERELQGAGREKGGISENSLFTS
ncbi:MAG: hypothetical protein L6Q47_06380 [Ignavibacteriaceae bacterium]|nr:hypothetical protein [Ignavibacteriaceae bacterium]